MRPFRQPICAIAAAAMVIGGLMAGPLSTSAAAAGESLTGAGSTLVAELMGNWTEDFKSRYGDEVTYSAVGSGAGIEQISARAVDFGASDAPLTPAQAGTCNNCVQIPWALSGPGVAYHLEGVGRLRLTGPVIAEIYEGKITNWDSKAIGKLNKGEHLPNLPISVVYRSDGSGTTYAFTNYLSSVSSSWKSKVGYATSVSFPTGTGAKGNAGVTAVVVSTNGSIGYIEASYIIAHHLSAAAVKNAAGKYEYPNLKNIEAAAQSVKSVPANNELHIVNPSRKYKTAYPISTFTYCIVPLGAPKKTLLSKFIYYAMTLGQRFGAAKDFAPVPKVVVNASLKTLRQLEHS